MATEKASITFYRITECGYYARGNETALFGNTAEVLEDLKTWSAGKTLIETKVGEVKETDTAGNVYLLDIRSKQGTWLLTMWNETASTQGKVASVQATSPVGDAEIHMNAIAEGSIPGYATYFWIVPSKGVFASLRFQHPYTAQKPFRAYINKFMETHGRHVVVGSPTEESDYPILGYVENDGDEPQHAYARFNTELKRNPGRKQFMLDNLLKINKIVRKETLDLSQPAELTFWQKMLRQAHLADPANVPIKARISYDFPFKPTMDDIENLFTAWEETAETHWDDFGIKITGSQDIYWVSHTLARKEFELPITRDNDEVVNADSLIDAVNTQKAQILQLV